MVHPKNTDTLDNESLIGSVPDARRRVFTRLPSKSSSGSDFSADTARRIRFRIVSGPRRRATDDNGDAIFVYACSCKPGPSAKFRFFNSRSVSGKTGRGEGGRRIMYVILLRVVRATFRILKPDETREPASAGRT